MLLSNSIVLTSCQKAGMFPYQWMFIIFGCITIVLGVSLWWLLPSSPLDCKWLNERERLIAIERLKDNRTGVKNTEHKKEQVIEAFTDMRVWMLVGAVFFHNMTNSLQTNFTGLILKGFGYTSYQSVLLQMPGGAIGAAAILLSGTFLSSRWGKNCTTIIMILLYIPGVIACCLLYAVPIRDSTRSAHLAAIFLIPIVAAAAGVMYSLLASNVAGYTKKSVSGVMFFSAYSVSNIVSPQTFLSKEAPKYTTGVFVTLGAFIINMILLSVLHIIYRRENAKRDRENEGVELDEVEDLANAFSDMTDRQNSLLRYKY